MRPGKDNADSINAALDAGKNLLFTPGIYHLQSSIRVTRAGTVVLGLGYPTLVPDRGRPAMVVSNVDGVKVGGLLFEAGTVESPALLEVGNRAFQHPIQPTLFFFTTSSAEPEAQRSERPVHSSPSTPTMSWATISGFGGGSRQRRGLELKQESQRLNRERQRCHAVWLVR